jgi:hypothetical protein
MLRKPLDLLKTQHRIDALVAELNRESAALAAAEQNIPGAASNTPAYPYQHAADQYAGGASGYNSPQLSQAYQAISAGAAKIHSITQELLGLQNELRTRLGDWNSDSDALRQGEQRIRKVSGLSASYRKAQDAAHRDKTQIAKLMNVISAAIGRVQRSIPPHAGFTSRRVGRSIDDIAGHGSDLYKIGPAVNYRPPITQYVVPALDRMRYGKLVLQPVTQYPSPRLRQDSSDGQETLWDKITRGLGYFDRENLHTYQVELPTYYYQMAPGSYTP